jgi:RimJ/RimL family protein N-acetyltransferase
VNRQLPLTLNFRPGKPEDLPAVQELCKDVWNGYDYMPREWERLLQETGSTFYVAETEQGQMAGFYGLQLFAEEDNKTGWWRGVRVGTPFRGKGIASRMVAHAIAECQRRGLQRFRYATADDNVPMHNVAERYNFRYVSPFTYAGSSSEIPPYMPASGLTTRPLSTDEAGIAWEFITHSQSWQTGEQLYCDWWSWIKLTLPRLEKFLAENGVVGCFEGEKLEALALFNTDSSGIETSIFVAWLDGRPDAVADLSLYLYQYAVEIGKGVPNNPLSFMVVYSPIIKELFDRLKFDLVPGEQMRVYELEL